MRRFLVGGVVVGLAVALAAPAFATGKQIICWERRWISICPFAGHYFDGYRFQTLIDQSQINYEGKINQVEFFSVYVREGTFNNYKLILSHCGSTSLSPLFADNYKGTPVTVADLSSFTIPEADDWFPLGTSTTTFDYNNTDHLLIEIQWKGDNGADCRVFAGAVVTGNHRVWAVNDPNASSGQADGVTFHTRLSFGAYPAVTPTSLGRVKAMY